MTDLESLDPETRCYALVGRFLQSWSALEGAIHDCIRTAFKLEPTALHIVCTNLTFWNKLNVLRTIVDITAIEDAEKTAIQRFLNRIGKYYAHRCMVAHDRFVPAANGEGVQFLTAQTKGKQETPAIVWTSGQFDVLLKTVNDYRTRLESLNAQLKTYAIQDRVYQESLAAALMTWQPHWDSTTYAMVNSLQRRMSPALARSLFAPPLPPPPVSSETASS
jgi:hypothetical protein